MDPPEAEFDLALTSSRLSQENAQCSIIRTVTKWHSYVIDPTIHLESVMFIPNSDFFFFENSNGKQLGAE